MNNRAAKLSPIVLASASPRRAELLRALGIPFQILPATQPELKFPGETPEDTVRRLSQEKAREVSRMRNDHWIIAADTAVITGEDEFLGKPDDEGDAVRMLRLLSGVSHRVLTGVTVELPESGETVGVYSEVAETIVHFHRIDEDEISLYVASGEPLDKAGAYGIQGRGSLLVERIEGSYTNVVGLPVALLYHMMVGAGFPFRGFWR